MLKTVICENKIFVPNFNVKARGSKIAICRGKQYPTIHAGNLKSLGVANDLYGEIVSFRVFVSL